MVAATGKKESVSLSLFMEVNNLDVEEGSSTMATLASADAVWLGTCGKRANEAVEEADL